jgi:hypothetical protein
MFSLSFFGVDKMSEYYMLIRAEFQAEKRIMSNKAENQPVKTPYCPIFAEIAASMPAHAPS